MRLRPTLLLALVLLASLVGATAARSTAAPAAGTPAADAQKRCKTVVKKVRVVKKVHGKRRRVVRKKRVRVCRAVRANPPSPIVARIDVGGEAWLVAAAADASVWADAGDEAVRIDPATNQITARVAGLGGVSAAAGSIWAGSFTSRTLTRLDPATGQVQATIALPHPPAAQIFAGAGALWVASGEEVAGVFAGFLTRVDPASNTVAATVPLCDVHGAGGTFAEGSLWFACYDTGEVLRLDPTTLTVQARIKLDPRLHSVAFGAGSLWVTGRQTGELSRIDTATNAVVARIATSRNVAVVFAADAVWAAGMGAVLKIDPATNRVVGRLPVGFAEYYSLAHSSGSLWLSSPSEQHILRLDPARLSRP